MSKKNPIMSGDFRYFFSFDRREDLDGNSSRILSRFFFRFRLKKKKEKLCVQFFIVYAFFSSSSI